jgi:FixJ family two-component response regulator
VAERPLMEPAPKREVWIVEDEPAAAALAVELCASFGAAPRVFRTSVAFLAALREATPPAVVVLDWRLERELSAALFMATRHRHRILPVVYWTGTVEALPGMVREDGETRIVDKAGGAAAFEEAIGWALARLVDHRPGNGGDAPEPRSE